MTNIENNFDEKVLKFEGISLVDFWAPWCGPCKMFANVFESAEKKFTKINFCKLNIDNDTNNICKEFSVMAIPTIIMFKNGKEIKRKVGFLNKEELEKFIGDLDV